MARKKESKFSVETEYSGVVRLKGDGAPTFRDLDRFLDVAFAADVQQDTEVKGFIGRETYDPLLGKTVSRTTDITIAVPAGPEYN